MSANAAQPLRPGDGLGVGTGPLTGTHGAPPHFPEGAGVGVAVGAGAGGMTPALPAQPESRINPARTANFFMQACYPVETRLHTARKRIANR